jgi:hypothetical protein
MTGRGASGRARIRLFRNAGLVVLHNDHYTCKICNMELDRSALVNHIRWKHANIEIKRDIHAV